MRHGGPSPAPMTTTTAPKLAQPVRRIAVPHHRGPTLRLERHPDAPDPGDLDAVRRWVRTTPRPRAVDLFCGAGGLSLGLRDAGFSILVGADNDPFAVETHTANVGGLGYLGDLDEPNDLLEHLDGWGIARVDLVAGGVPCQPFSRAGQSKIRDLVRTGTRTDRDPRAQLWRSFMTIVERLSPRAVLVENVPDLPAWDDGAVLIALYESLRDLGYAVDARTMECFRHGVPQHRTRLIIVATRDMAEFVWPARRRGTVTLRDAIGDLPPVPGGQRADTLPYRPRAGRRLTAFQRGMRAHLPAEHRDVIHDHITRAVREDDMRSFELLEEGHTYSDLPEELRRYRSDIFTDKYKRLSWGQVSRTITAHIAKDGYWYIHPEQHRTLSIREAARLQTFPDRFRFAGNPSHRYRQIGNAVPPALGQAIGRSLTAALGGRRSRSRERQPTRDALLHWHRKHRRSYPWRASDLSPWHVLMAEMCLHRTRADQVAPVFGALLRIAPTPEAMVERSDDALDAMRSLGLRWRAENVIDVARSLCELFDGEVPDEDFELRMLPGVGDYVAQAVLCFGFGRRAVLLDTNTMRIVSRLHGRDADRRWQLRLDLHRLAGARGPDAEFNYALLDLGALVCRAGTPHCERCPLRERCTTGGGATPPDQIELEPDGEAP